MPILHEERRAGLEYLDMITTLLQRVRNAHPTEGSFQAAEVQWFWSVPRRTDAVDQLFWIDEQGTPEAAVVVNDFGDGSSLLYGSPTLLISVMPGSSADWVGHVVDRGLAHVASLGIEAVEIEVSRTADAMRSALFDRGFEVREDGLIECWLDAARRPPVSALGVGYRLCSRAELADRPHHMANDRRRGIQQRLGQMSLYRPEFDVVVLDAAEQPAAYGLFWYDPVTATGTVEPMRTHDAHQRRGLARHILTAGLDRLADAGAERISICFEPDNPASGPLYESVGFEPHGRTDMLSGPTRAER